ncbi:MAG: head GIN domain-containing protein [Erythrobacter sp.]
MTRSLPNALFSIPILAVAFSLAAFGSDETINGIKGVPLAELDQSGAPPTELVLAGASKVIVTEGETLTIVVEGDDDAVDALRFVRDGDMLGITEEDDNWGESDEATVRVTMPAPEELTVGGSGSIEAATLAKDAEVVIGGSGSMAIAAIASDTLEIVIGGSGSVKASGGVKTLNVSIGGSGSARLDKLKADEADITIGGSGSVKLRSDGEVSASIGGSGSVKVVGTANCEAEISGSGRLNCSPDA